MLDAIGTTRAALTAAHQLGVRVQVAVGSCRLASLILGGLAATMAFDLFFPLENFLRALFMIAGAAWSINAALALRGRARAEQVRLERAARLLESRHPELENALINAVQFDAALTAHPETPAAPLMRREIARAAREAEALPLQEAADTVAVAHARRRLLLVACVVLAPLLLFPRVCRFELPRFFLFWADYPPFTLTDFHVTPQGAHVKVGGRVTITVRLGGLIPSSVSLVTSSDRLRERVTPFYASDDGVYTQTLENLTQNTDYYVRGETGRSARYRITVDQAPTVKTVRVTLHPPAYTHRNAETSDVSDLSAAGVSGLFGTQVDLDVEATRPLQSGSLTLAYSDAPEETVTLSPLPGKPDHAGGSFTIRREGLFRLALTAEDDLTTPDAAHGPIHLLRDEKPIVYLTLPGRNAVVPPDMTVPIQAQAEDDIAVQRIELHRIVNNMTDSVQSFPVAPSQRHAEANAALDLKDLGARPGDVIQYYATAYDNDPGRPHLTDSERYWLWVVSAEDYRRLLAQQRGLPQLAAEYRAQTEALRSLAADQRALAEKMKALQAQKNGANRQAMESLQREQSDLRKRAQELMAAMRKLAAQKPQYDVEKGLQKRLSELARMVGQAADGAMRQAESAHSPGTMAQQGEKAAQQLERANGQSQKSIEKALLALEKLAPLYQDIARLKQLTTQQGNLALQARALARQGARDAFAKSRLQDLAEQQTQAAMTLHDLQQALQEHARECVGIAPSAAGQAVQIASALSALGIGKTMSDAANAFGIADAPTGAGHAERAQRALESLFHSGKGCQNGAQQSLDSQLGMCLGQGSGKTLDQLAQNAPGNAGVEGRGVAQGSGGMSAPQPGSRPGDGSQSSGSSRQIQTLALQQQQGQSRRREDHRHPPGAELSHPLSGQDVEQTNDASRKPPPAADPAGRRYPTEYRKLVNDYFKAVAGGK